MGATAIIGIVVGLLTLIFGSGFLVSLWRGRRRISIGVRHGAMDGNYEVDFQVTNAGERDEHLTAIRVTALDPLEGRWTTKAVEIDAETDLPSRGQPARHTFVLPAEWVEQRARFRVEAKISSRERWFRSGKERTAEAVLAVLEAEA